MSLEANIADTGEVTFISAWWMENDERPSSFCFDLSLIIQDIQQKEKFYCWLSHSF